MFKWTNILNMFNGCYLVKQIEVILLFISYICGRNKKYFMMERFSEIINSNQLTLVDFFATWCGPCKTMHPVLEQLKKELGDSIRIIKLDVDKNQNLSINYGIQSVPTLMLFRNGNVLWRQSGAMSLSNLKALISQYQ